MSSSSRHRADKSSASRFVADGGAASRFPARNGSASRFMAYGGSSSRWSPDELDAALLSALSNLSPSLTINGQTKTPSLLYYGADASASDWAAAIGEDCPVVSGGTALSPDQETPLVKATDRSVLFNAGEYYQAASSAGSQIGNGNDWILEGVIRPTAVGVSMVADKRQNGGWQFRQAGNLIDMLGWDVVGGVAARSVIVSPNAWIRVFGVWHYGNSAVVYVDLDQGPAIDVSPVGDMSVSTAKMTLGANPAGGNAFDGATAYMAVWQGLNWLDSHLQPTVNAARQKALVGSNTDEERDSLAYLHKPVSGALKYFLVGKDWMRQSKGLTGGAYYQKESAATNIHTESHDATGAVTQAASVAAGTWTPFEGLPATMVTEDGTLSAHTAYNTLVSFSPGATYTISVHVKRHNRNMKIVLTNTSVGTAYAVFNLSTGVVDDSGGTGYVDSGMTALGDGYLCSIVITSQAPGARSAGVRYFGIDELGNDSYTGANLDMWEITGEQVEVSSSISSQILTSGASVTRAADA